MSVMPRVRSALLSPTRMVQVLMVQPFARPTMKNASMRKAARPEAVIIR